MTDAELNQILLENRRMRVALEFIQKWALPRQNYRGDPSIKISYESAHGSNGAKEFMRAIAMNALE